MGKKNPNKFKVLCKECYATDYSSSDIAHHNVKKLVFYALSNPDKLESIASYLLAKLGRRIRKVKKNHKRRQNLSTF